MKIVLKVLTVSVLGLASCTSISKKQAVVTPVKENVFKPYVTYEIAEKRATDLMAKFTLEQKIDFVKGYENFFIRPVPELGIPLVYLTDASQGIHIRAAGDSYVNLNSIFKQPKKSTAFPPTIQLAATFNNELAHNYAEAIGEECRASGIHVLLGPGLNIYRNSQCGRNFEYLGEDPYLVSQMVKNYVVGMQNTGTMATIKHFIGNQAEYYRKQSNSIISERAINEIYLPGFKAGVNAGAQSVMTAYNLLNGEWTGQSKWLIKDVLKGQLGFEGFVMSDWGSVRDAKKIVSSGQSIVMPLGRPLKNLDKLIENGEVKESQLDEMIQPILRSCIVMGFYDRDQKDEKYLGEGYYKKHSEIALQTAREGIVLLKNNDVLPVKHNNEILVTGKYVNQFAKGLGSGEVTGYNNIDLKSALEVEFENQITVNENPSDEAIKNAKKIFLSVGMSDGEGFDRPFELKGAEEAFIKKVTGLNKNVVIIVNCGSAFKMSNWADKAAAIVWAWYPGQIGNKALAEVLSGKVNPSGKLPMTIEKYFKDSPAYGYIPEGKPALKYESVHWKKRAKLGQRTYDVEYKEGVLVGYRWYDTKNIEPMYPFGHGLSYTQFELSDLAVKQAGENVSVSFEIENIGDVAGTEVVQVYVKDNQSSVIRPVKELKAYEKVALVKGASKEVTLSLGKEAFSFWNPETKKWTLEKGEFTILVGTSSRAIALSKTIEL
ncbi:glycoside hydrolase family 3 C-terminal domain-containing protein [Flavobacteriaceae bacterium]|nr:glycoside hydrolase family 3 C-terminal domain-containing protein [Flavobacteriaceae bacterium]